MFYYLSYLEINGHAALMLSGQRSYSEPVEVLCEIGFAYSPDVDDTVVGYFTRHTGEVREETNTSRILYSEHASAQHRTYEISEEEADRLFQIINRDRRKNAREIRLESIVDGEKVTQLEVVGGGDYQKIKHNCKTYAMGVFKELGIVEAREIENFLIQRTCSHTQQLRTLSKGNFEAPKKDELIQKHLALLNSTERALFEIKANQQLLQLEQQESSNSLLEAALLETPEDAVESFFTNIEKAIVLCQDMRRRVNKIGVEDEYLDWQIELCRLINNINSIQDCAEVDTKEPFSEERFGALLDDLEEAEERLSDTEDAIDHVSTKDLRFFWKAPLEISPRLVFSHFDFIQKEVFLVTARMREVEGELRFLIKLIDEKIMMSKTMDSKLTVDLFSLKGFLKDAQSRFEQDKNHFFDVLDNAKEEKEKSDLCSQQHKKIDAILSSFDSRLSDFKPKSEEEIGSIVRFFKKVLAYLCKKFTALEYDPKGVVQRDIQKLRPKPI